MNDRDVFKELQKSLTETKGHLHVLDVSIPVEEQMNYFRFSENLRIRGETDATSIEEQILRLNSPESTAGEIKFALAYLAVSGEIKAYRAIETYDEEHKNPVNNWTLMALQQAKINLESEFSDEKQIFISTGLGGRGDRLRFFAFFTSNRLRKFSGYQKELIEKEIPYCVRQYQGETEEIKIEDNYFTILFLITIQTDIKHMLEQAISECNQYGDFINKSFIVTNVKVFSELDIQRELRKLQR
jgi:hypothetical protein